MSFEVYRTEISRDERGGWRQTSPRFATVDNAAEYARRLAWQRHTGTIRWQVVDSRGSVVARGYQKVR